MQDLNDWIIKLKEDSKNKIVLVEGKNDKKVLEDNGVSNIITLSKPIFEITEEIIKDGRECIILVDLDKEGKSLYHKLRFLFQKYGIKTDNKFREFLFENTKIRQIEGLKKHL